MLIDFDSFKNVVGADHHQALKPSAADVNRRSLAASQVAIDYKIVVPEKDNAAVGDLDAIKVNVLHFKIGIPTTTR